MRANTPLELWKKVFEKTFPPKVSVYMSAAQLLFTQNSSNITTNFFLSSLATGISVSLSSLFLLTFLIHKFLKDTDLYVVVL